MEDQDVAGDPDVTLIEAMRLAAHRDGIAREYATSSRRRSRRAHLLWSARGATA